MKFVKGETGNPAVGRRESFNFAGLLTRRCWTPIHPSVIFLLFPCSTLLFSADFPSSCLFHYRFAFCPPPFTGIYRDLARPRAEEIIGATIKAAKDGEVAADAPLLGSLCARPQKCADVPDPTVIHINFIRIMSNALVMTTCDDFVGWANALANPRFTNDVKARLPTPNAFGRGIKRTRGQNLSRA
jgi:hypothetical protein